MKKPKSIITHLLCNKSASLYKPIVPHACIVRSVDPLWIQICTEQRPKAISKKNYITQLFTTLKVFTLPQLLKESN